MGPCAPDPQLLLKFLECPEKQRGQYPLELKWLRILKDKMQMTWDKMEGGNLTPELLPRTPEVEAAPALKQQKQGRETPQRKLKQDWLKRHSRSHSPAALGPWVSQHRHLSPKDQKVFQYLSSWHVRPGAPKLSLALPTSSDAPLNWYSAAGRVPGHLKTKHQQQNSEHSNCN